MPSPTPDTVSIDQLKDLHQRLRGTRHVPNPWGQDATRGVPTLDLAAQLDLWATDYDWRAHEDRIRAYPWAMCGTGRSSLRLIHRPSSNPSATAVMLLHGWPDSVLRFERVLPLLQDLHVVVPALPGFPFALPLKEPVSVTQIAAMVADAMAELGYDRYVVSGGDVGGTVAEIMAAEYPERVTALHLTNLSAARAAMVDPASLPADALAYLGQVGQWRRTEAGFVAEQSTRPSTLMASLGDSPAGLLAWIGEKLIDWSDTVDGERAFSPDDLLTWISAYWFTDTIGTSFSTYVQPARLPARIEAPTALSAFAHDIMPAPRSWAETFVNVAEFIEHESGGHFAAWERPQDYADDVRHAAGLTSASPM